MLEPLLEKIQNKIIDINQLDNDTRKMIEQYKEMKEKKDENILSDSDLIEEAEEEYEQEEEESLEIPEEYYNRDKKNIEFSYLDSKVVVSWNLDLEIKIENQTIKYFETRKILELLDPDFSYIIEFFIDKYAIKQKIDDNIHIKKQIEEIKTDINNLKPEPQFPRFNKFFNVPEQDQIKQKVSKNKINELFSKIDKIASDKRSISKNRKSKIKNCQKTKNKK